VKVVSRQQACGILGISITASLSEAKVAYRALVLLYHPDFVDRLGPELKKIAHIKTTEINAAMAFIAKG
jgi:DnaJ-class molecular chaperone